MIPLLALSLGLFINANTQAATAPEILKADSSETSYLVNSNSPLISIPLESNRTTGYNWYLEEYNEKLIQPITSYYDSDTNSRQSGMVGTPGVTTWKFTILEPAFQVPTVTKIVLRYAKSWNQSSSITKTIWIYTSGLQTQSVTSSH